VGSLIPIETDIVLQFSKEMDTSSTLLGVTVSGPSLPTYLPIWTDGNRTLILDFDSNLSYGQTYSVRIDSLLAVDLEGNPLDGNNNFQVDGSLDDVIWDFTTIPVPIVVATDPLDGELDVEVSREIRITFSEQMDQSSVLAAFSTNPSVGGFASWENNTFVFTPVSLAYGTVYQVMVDGNVAVSLSGILLDGDGDGEPGGTYSFSFTTVYLPVVTSHTPEDLALNISVETDLILTFNKQMNRSSVESSIAITPATPTWTANWSMDGTVVVLNLSANLSYGTTYTVSVGGPTAKDVDGYPLDGNLNNLIDDPDTYTFSFTTDFLPWVVDTVPADGETDVPAYSSIRILFSEKMNESSFEGQVFIEPETPFQTEWSLNEFWIKPLGLLDYETAYTVTIGGLVSDLQGNTLDGNRDNIQGGSSDSYSFSFTTSPPDRTPPQVVSTVPQDGETEVEPSTPVVVTFNEPMDQATTELAFHFYYGTDEWTIKDFIPHEEEWPFEWDLGNRNLTFIPRIALGFDLVNDTVYSVKIDGTAEDLSGNRLDGNGNGVAEGSPADDYQWTFTTHDTKPPTVSILEPQLDSSYLKGSTIYARGRAEDSIGIATLYISIDGGEWIDITDFYDPETGTWSYEIDTSSLDLGGHTLAVRGVDLAGHESGHQVTFKVTESPGVSGLVIALLAALIVILLIVVGFWGITRRREEEEPPTAPEEE